MDPLPESSIASLQAIRLQQLVKSLSATRTAQRSDICIVCEGNDFFAHKWVLESVSPYFATMFTSGLEEAETGRIEFNHIEVETIETILDFIYQGTVENIATDKQFKNVLTASHLLQLEELFQYCCTSIGNRLTEENFFEAFHLSEKLESNTLHTKTEEYWITNSSKLLSSDKLNLLSLSEMETLIRYFKCRKLCLDPMTKGVVTWLTHDVERGEMYASEILKCIDVRLLSKAYVQSLLKNQESIHYSEAISRELKELGITSLLSDSNDFISTPCLSDTQYQQWATTLSYFSRDLVFEVFDPASNCDVFPVSGKDSVQRNSLQQFDLCTMKWLPISHPNLESEYLRSTERFCQNKHEIYLFSVDNPYEYGVYNLLNHALTQKRQEYTEVRSACTVYYFNGSIFVFGGTPSTNSVYYFNPRFPKWHDLPSLILEVGKYPTVLAATDCMYVIADKIPASEKKLVIQYAPDSWDWKVVGIRNEGLHPSQFFISDNVLNALHFLEYECRQLVFNKESKTFTIKRKFNWPDNESLRVSKFQNPESPFVFFSKKDDNFSLPYMYLEIETGVWTKLPAPQGGCQIQNTEQLEPIYSLQQTRISVDTNASVLKGQQTSHFESLKCEDAME